MVTTMAINTATAWTATRMAIETEDPIMSLLRKCLEEVRQRENAVREGRLGDRPVDERLFGNSSLSNRPSVYRPVSGQRSWNERLRGEPVRDEHVREEHVRDEPGRTRDAAYFAAGREALHMSAAGFVLAGGGPDLLCGNETGSLLHH